MFNDEKSYTDYEIFITQKEQEEPGNLRSDSWSQHILNEKNISWFINLGKEGLTKYNPFLEQERKYLKCSKIIDIVYINEKGFNKLDLLNNRIA